MRWSSRRSLLAQTLLAQLQQTLLATDIFRSVAGLNGNFSERVIHGKTYWYYRYSPPGGKEVQIYLGPDSQDIRDLVARKEDTNAKQAHKQLGRLVRTCVGAGCPSVPVSQFKLIRQLSQYGFFHAGGVLAGTHAFLAYANMLGLDWNSEAYAQTVDVDFAHAGRNISVALPTNLKVDVSGAIESLQEGFLPRLSHGSRSGSWVHATDPDYVIDFITPQTGDSAEPFEFEPLGIALQPLRFLEFSMIGVQQGVLLSNNQAVMVNLPDPARYALHKLIVHVQRRNSPKSQKDLKQSAALLEVLKQDRPRDLIEVWDDLQSRGPGWRRRVEEGFRALDIEYEAESFPSWVEENRERLENEELPEWRKNLEKTERMFDFSVELTSTGRAHRNQGLSG